MQRQHRVCGDCTRNAALRGLSAWGAARWLAVAGLAVLLAGCGSSGGDGGWLRLVLEEDAGVDTSGANNLFLQVTTPGSPVLFEEIFPLAGGEISLEEIPMGANRFFHVEMRAGVAVLAEGDAGPETLAAGNHTTVVVILRAP